MRYLLFILFVICINATSYSQELKLIKDINSVAVPVGSDSAAYTVVNNKVLFAATNRETGRELWRVNAGANSATKLPEPIIGTTSSLSGGSGSGRELVTSGNLIFYVVDNGYTITDEIWVSNGTETGTFKVFSDDQHEYELSRPIDAIENLDGTFTLVLNSSLINLDIVEKKVEVVPLPAHYQNVVRTANNGNTLAVLYSSYTFGTGNEYRLGYYSTLDKSFRDIGLVQLEFVSERNLQLVLSGDDVLIFRNYTDPATESIIVYANIVTNEIQQIWNRIGHFNGGRYRGREFNNIVSYDNRVLFFTKLKTGGNRPEIVLHEVDLSEQLTVEIADFGILIEENFGISVSEYLELGSFGIMEESVYLSVIRPVGNDSEFLLLRYDLNDGNLQLIERTMEKAFFIKKYDSKNVIVERYDRNAVGYIDELDGSYLYRDGDFTGHFIDQSKISIDIRSNEFVVFDNKIITKGRTNPYVYDDEPIAIDLSTVKINLIQDINTDSNSTSNIKEMVAIGNKVYFSATDGIEQANIWESNGSIRGTKSAGVPFDGDVSSIENMTAFEDKIVFTAFITTDLEQTNNLFAFDTKDKELVQLTEGLRIEQVINFKNQIIVKGGEQLSDYFRVSIDGGGYSLLNEQLVNFNHNGFNLLQIDSHLLYELYSESTPNSREIWISDGTAVGSTKLEFFEITSPEDEMINNYQISDGSIFYSKLNINTFNTDLYEYDITNSESILRKSYPSQEVLFIHLSDQWLCMTISTTVGVVEKSLDCYNRDDKNVNTIVSFSQIGADFSNRISFFNEAVNNLYFELNGTLYVSDGEQGNYLSLITTIQGISNSWSFSDGLYFINKTFYEGDELWFSDGVMANTKLIAETVPYFNSSWIENVTQAGANIFFSADNILLGNELYGLIVNVQPEALNDERMTMPNTVININVLENDFDDDGSLIASSVSIHTTASNGELSILQDGVVQYTPTAGYGGIDTFSYTVSDDQGMKSQPAIVKITVNELPDVGNDLGETNFQTPIVVNILMNDSDSDGEIVNSSVSITSNPINGFVIIQSHGQVQYTPNSGFSGGDSFQYTVKDNLGAESLPATVTITVKPNAKPSTTNDSANTNYQTAVTINVLANDSDSDGSIDASSVVITTIPANGTTSVFSDGQIQYTPNNGFSGSDSIQYTVKDNNGAVSNAATVSISVRAQTTTPAAPTSTGGGGSFSYLFLLFLLIISNKNYRRKY